MALIERHPTWRRGVAGGLAALALLSVGPLWDVIGWWTVGGVAAAGVLLVTALVSDFCRALAQVLGALVVPWLCLLGFNWLWHRLIGDHVRPSLELGLILAGVVFAIAAAAYLLLWGEGRRATPWVAVGLALANVVGVPLLLGAPKGESVVAAPQPVMSQLDVAILVPGADVGELPPSEPARQPDLDVRYSVGRADRDPIAWLLLDSADPQAARAAARGTGAPLPGGPAWRLGADQLVLLDVDGTPPVTPDPAALPSVPGTKGEVTRWLDRARRAAPNASVAVLLQTTDPARIDAWARKVEPRGGTVASVQRLGTGTLTDAALRLAAEAPGASEELSLALRFRPVLLFDRGERLNTPLDIDGFLGSGRVELCHDDRLSGSRCARVSRSSDLVNGATHLRIAQRADRDPASTIYVHPTAVKQGLRKLLYLDYWWYLDGNPANVGQGTSCGVGLALPGKTCFNHQSDWEGMTVVLDRTGSDAVPIAVQYAAHSDVVRYDFSQLHDDWADRRQHDPRWRTPHMRRTLAGIDDLDRRPLAFIARGTHAAYRDLCAAACRQVAAKLPENPHDGFQSWPGNDTAHCIAASCLRLLPTRHGGRDPALWNAYAGVWGERRCILRGAYCSAEVSPGAPATQRRYERPARISGYVDDRWTFRGCIPEQLPCPPPAGS